MEVCNCSMYCCTLLYVHSSIAIILMGKRELIALLNLSSWCLVMVERLFLAVPRGSLQFVIVVFPNHTHLLFLGTDRSQIQHYQENMWDEEVISNPHSVVVVMAAFHVWAGSLSNKSRTPQVSFPGLFLAIPSVVTTISLHYMHRLSRDLAQDNQ